MSLIGDCLYFAPEIPFSELDLSGERLPRQFQDRIMGFYLKPAIELAQPEPPKRPHDFASGVLSVCAIDSMARLMADPRNGVGKRIKEFCKKIPDLAEGSRPKLFCDQFRNGLVHEGRIKDGSEFSLNENILVVQEQERLRVNPLLLANAIASLLESEVLRLETNPNNFLFFRDQVKSLFEYEIENFHSR